MITLDGSEGEGGGQILRTALAASLITQTPFHIHAIRAGRPKPGLLRQHLAAVRAAVLVGEADVEGDALGSTSLRFVPKRVRQRDLTLDLGGAGSTGLVLQTVCWPLWLADGPSTLTLSGGTHNPWAPPYPFLASSFGPAVERTGVGLALSLDAVGFYPAGGGKMTAVLTPTALVAPLDLCSHDGTGPVCARVIGAAMPSRVLDREAEQLRRRLPENSEITIRHVESSGPGNALWIEAGSAFTSVFSAYGRRGTRAEAVADEAVDAWRTWRAAGAVVCEQLADQLLLPLVLAGGGAFRTSAPTRHSTTQVDVLARFFDVRPKFTADGRSTVVTL